MLDVSLDILESSRFMAIEKQMPVGGHSIGRLEERRICITNGGRGRFQESFRNLEKAEDFCDIGNNNRNHSHDTEL